MWLRSAFSRLLLSANKEALTSLCSKEAVRHNVRSFSLTAACQQFPHRPSKLMKTPVYLKSPAMVNENAKPGEPRFRPAKYKVDYLELYQPFFYQTLSSEEEVFEHHERIFHKLHSKGPPIHKRKKNKLLDGKPFAKGVVLKTLIRKPKKPNSANRKCLRLRLTNGKEVIAKVPGVGHNLQEHNLVLVRGGRSQDLPGVKLKACRGRFDLQHVKKPTLTKK